MWRDKVKNWLAVVRLEARWTREWIAAAQHNGAAFPSNLIVKIIRLFFEPLATRIVKGALRDAASELGLTLSEADLDALANIAVALA